MMLKMIKKRFHKLNKKRKFNKLIQINKIMKGKMKKYR